MGTWKGKRNRRNRSAISVLMELLILHWWWQSTAVSKYPLPTETLFTKSWCFCSIQGPLGFLHHNALEGSICFAFPCVWQVRDRGLQNCQDSCHQALWGKRIHWLEEDLQNQTLTNSILCRPRVVVFLRCESVICCKCKVRTLKLYWLLTLVSDGHGQTKSVLKGPERSLICPILSTTTTKKQPEGGNGEVVLLFSLWPS